MAEHPNVERMRQGYKAFAEGDLDTLRNERFAPDIVFHVTNLGALTGDYKGVDEVFAFFGRLMEETDGTFKIDVHDLLANDEHSVALVRTSATRKGRTLEQNAVHVFHVNAEGKITENWGFPEDSAAANDFFS